MDINTENENGILVAQAEGRIDGSNAHDFEDAMQSAIGDDHRAVIIDCGGLTYISSAGLRAVLLIAKTLKKRDIDFALCSLSGPIEEVFKISGFDKIVRLHGSRSDAVSSVGA